MNGWKMLLIGCVTTITYSVAAQEKSKLPDQAAQVLRQMDQDVTAAKNKAVSRLQPILESEMRMGHLDTANAVKAAIDQLKIGGAEPVTVVATAGSDNYFKTVKIVGNKNPGLELGKFKKGDKITMSYVSGIWAAGSQPLSSPDANQWLPCVIQAKVGKTYALVATVPLGTKDKPFEYTFETDMDSVVANEYSAPNCKGEATYKLAVKRVQ